jgi:hypothetical protein
MLHQLAGLLGICFPLNDGLDVSHNTCCTDWQEPVSSSSQAQFASAFSHTRSMRRYSESENKYLEILTDLQVCRAPESEKEWFLECCKHFSMSVPFARAWKVERILLLLLLSLLILLLLLLRVGACSWLIDGFWIGWLDLLHRIHTNRN